ncbi:aspartate aminotransferase family protein [Chloroflexota bacterium]
MAPYEKAIEYLSPVLSHYTPIVAERGVGSYIYDQDGVAYLDFTCGIGVTNTGHCHPDVVNAIKKQAEELIHGQVNIVVHKPVLELIENLRSIVPPEIDSFFFSNSGAEAVEGAIKLARQTTGKPNVIVFQGSFHGRTVGTMSLTTSKTIYRAGYQPLMPGVFVSPFPYALRYGWEEEVCSQWCLKELEYLLMTQTAPSETAAVLIEPVLGEGGYVVPPIGFLQGVRDICDRHDFLLIVDEIQSGFGRAGRWFAHEYFDVRPDIITVAKGIASGMPMSGIFSTQEIMGKWIPGSHGGTYGGNPVSAAAAVATISAIKGERMMENAISRGEQLMDGLRSLQHNYPHIAQVRGLGLMVGAEIRTQNGQPDKEKAKALVKACLNLKLILLTCGPWDNTIRWIPPLVVTREQVDQALTTFEDALNIIG